MISRGNRNPANAELGTTGIGRERRDLIAPPSPPTRTLGQRNSPASTTVSSVSSKGSSGSNSSTGTRTRARYGDVARLDRILESEGDDPNGYQLTKQADARMLLYVLSRRELGSLLERLGYDWDDELFDRMIEYYEPRTAHGSTLSRVVHAWNQAQRDRERSWHLFVEALYSDLNDAQGGSSARSPSTSGIRASSCTSSSPRHGRVSGWTRTRA